MSDQHDQHDQQDRGLLARLRSADPASSLSPAAPARVARLLEETMSHDVESRTDGARGRSPLTWGVAAAAVLVIIGGAVVVAVTGDGPGTDDTPAVAAPSPTVTELTAPVGAPARCQVPNARTIGNAEVAFAGTVDTVDDGLVTLTPTRFYAGEETDVVTVEAPPDSLRLLLASVEFRPGGRYLVAASSSGGVMVCGISAPWSEGLAALYEQAFAD